MTFGSTFRGSAATYLGANVLNAGIPLLLLPVLTRVLSPADYGVVAMFAILLSIFGAFTGLSLHGAIGVRYFQLDAQALAEYVGSCMTIVAVSTAATLLVVTILRTELERVSGVPTDWLLAAVVVSGMQALGAIRLSLWQAAGQAPRYGAFQISQSLLNAGLSLLLVLAAGLAWRGRVLGQVSAIALFGVVAVWLLHLDGLVAKPRAWREQSRDALKFGVPLIPHALGALATATAGQTIVTNMLGVAETGLYVVGLQMGAAMGLISDAFVKTYAPWMYAQLRDDSIAAEQFIVGVTYCVLAALLLLSGVMSVAIFIFFPLIVGDEFQSAKSLTPWFVFGNGFVGMYYAVAGLFFFSSKTHFVSIATLSSGVMAVASMWILGEAFGLKGIAIGYCVSQAATFVLAWLLSHWARPMPWSQLRAARAAFASRWSRDA